MSFLWFLVYVFSRNRGPDAAMRTAHVMGSNERDAFLGGQGGVVSWLVGVVVVVVVVVVGG